MYTKTVTLTFDYNDDGSILVKSNLNYSDPDAAARWRDTHPHTIEVYDLLTKSLAATIFKFGHDPITAMTKITAQVLLDQHTLTISGNLRDSSLN